MRSILLSPAILGILVVLLISCGEKVPPEELFKMGLKAESWQERDKAYSYYRRAAKAAPDSSAYHWAASVWAPDRKTAYKHGLDAWETGNKSQVVLKALLRLSDLDTDDEKFAYAKKLYDELPESQKTREFLGDLYYTHKMYDSALAVYTQLYNERPRKILSSKIGASYQKSGNDRAAKKFLMKCLRHHTLSGPATVLLAAYYAEENKLYEIDSLLQRSGRLGLITNNEILDIAKIIMAHKEIFWAGTIFGRMRFAEKNQNDALWNHKARVLFAFANHEVDSIDNISKLLPLITVENDLHENELKFFMLLVKMTQNKAGQYLRQLKVYKKKMPPNVAVDILLAREYAKESAYDTAEQILSKIPEYMIHYPYFGNELALYQVKQGKMDEAYKRWRMYERLNMYTPEFGKDFNNLLLTRLFVREGREVALSLTKKYGDAVGEYWKNGLSFLETGDYESAEELFLKAREIASDEPLFPTALLCADYGAERFGRVLSEERQQNENDFLTVVFTAWAYENSSRSTAADSLFQAQLKKQASSEMRLAYAYYLALTGKASQAGSVMKDISFKTDAFTNFRYLHSEWLYSLSRLLHRDSVGVSAQIRDAAALAFTLAPDSIVYLENYAEILLAGKNYQTLISVLKNSEKLATSGELHWYLARAYEETGKKVLALEQYKSALKQLGKRAALDIGVGVEVIDRAIVRVSQ